MEQNQNIFKRQYLKFRNMHFTDINPRDAGFQACPPGYEENFHQRLYYILHYIVSGEGVFYSGRKRYHVSQGEAFLIQPNKTIKYSASLENPWSYIWIGFEGEFAKELSKIKGPVFKLNSEPFEKVKECLNYSNMREVFLVGCISQILCEILDTSEKIDTISSVKNYIDANCMFNIKVSDIASLMNISTSHLTRIFKAQTGVTLRDYIMKKKMKAAKKLLDSGYNINETTQMIGYTDQSVFSRAFKKYYGYSPSAIR